MNSRLTCDPWLGHKVNQYLLDKRTINNALYQDETTYKGIP